MAVPSVNEIMPAVLEICGDGKVHNSSELKERLTAKFKLTKKDLEERMHRQCKLSYNMALATNRLRTYNLLESQKRGRYSITDYGLKILSQKPIRIGRKPPDKPPKPHDDKSDTQYIGKAGEFRVASELLFREYNANIASVDKGIDIIATKNDKIYNIQVKTANIKNNRYYVSMRKDSLAKSSKNTYFVFVLRAGGTAESLILRASKVKKLASRKKPGKSPHLTFVISNLESDARIGGVDVKDYLNNWDILKKR